MSSSRILAVVVLLWLCGCTAAPKADLIIYNATIWTGDDGQPEASAMAIAGDTIVAIGSLETLEQWKDDGTTMLDAGGQFITPGFVDAHVHFLSGGMRLQQVQLRTAQQPSVFIARIADYTSSVPDGTWIEGGDWDHENWGGTLPAAAWIDSVTPNHPVFVIRLDGHMGLANTTAMQLAGIDASTPDVSGGTIVRDAKGNPTGIFKDNAMDLLFKVIPEPSPALLDRFLQAATEEVASHGVTTVHSVGDYGPLNDLETFKRGADQQQLKTRALVAMPLSQWRTLSGWIEQHGRGDKWVRTGLLKGFVDGSLGSHTAAFMKPFSDAPKDSGFMVTEPDSLYSWIQQADAAGLQCAIHAIGDKANQTILDIFERVERTNDTRDRRFRIEHAQHLDAADIPRFKSLGVIASMQPYHAIDDGRWAEKIIGPERITTTYAFRDLLDAGATLAFGSDWFVAPPTPLEGIYAAVTRRTLDDRNPEGWVPQQKITVEEALQAYTSGSALAGFMEQDRGKLKPGMLADFVIMEKDIRKIPPEDIRTVNIVATFVGGKKVFAKP